MPAESHVLVRAVQQMGLHTPHFRSFQLKTLWCFRSLPFFHNAAVCSQRRFLVHFIPGSPVLTYSYSALVALLPVSVHPLAASAKPAPKTTAGAFAQGTQILCPVQYSRLCLQIACLQLCLTVNPRPRQRNQNGGASSNFWAARH